MAFVRTSDSFVLNDCLVSNSKHNTSDSPHLALPGLNCVISGFPSSHNNSNIPLIRLASR